MCSCVQKSVYVRTLVCICKQISSLTKQQTRIRKYNINAPSIKRTTEEIERHDDHCLLTQGK